MAVAADLMAAEAADFTVAAVEDSTEAAEVSTVVEAPAVVDRFTAAEDSAEAVRRAADLAAGDHSAVDVLSAADARLLKLLGADHSAGRAEVQRGPAGRSDLMAAGRTLSAAAAPATWAQRVERATVLPMDNGIRSGIAAVAQLRV